MTTLANAICEPCSKDAQPLSKDEAQERHKASASGRLSSTMAS